MNPQDIYKEALSHHQAGRLAQAEPLYLKLAAAAPDNFPTRYMIALLRFQQGRAGEALAAVEIALKLDAHAPDALSLRAALLQAAGRHGEALAGFDAALARRPDASNWFNRGSVLQSLGRNAEALRSFEQARTLNPRHVEAWKVCGTLLQNAGRRDEALAAYEQCLALHPGDVEVWSNRGTVLMDLKRFEEALAALDRAVTMEPDRAALWHNRAMALRGLGRSDEALAAYDRALVLDPDLAPALNNRSAILWKEKRNYHDAVRDMEHLVHVAPGHDFARGLLLHLKMYGCDWQDYARESVAVQEDMRAGKHVVQPFVYQAISTSPEDLQKCSALYASYLYPETAPLPLKGNRDHRKIRLGYMSGEMREQAVGFLMVGVFEHHDKERFELIVLDNGRDDGGPTRKRINGAVDRLIDITRLSNQEAAARIRDEEIDILVNLNGYFGNVRMEIFGQRPAPIQVNYLGLPATLGAPYMDYIVADSVVIPDAERRFYTEKVVHLPDTYWPTDNRQAIAADTPSRAACGLPDQGIIFCNFNQSYKLTPEMFSVWMRILSQVEGSVLWLHESYDVTAPNLRREAEKRGIAGERLIFVQLAPLERHLARIRLADLALDGIPYNQHTTGCDVLWAGVPLLTCPGTTFPGRVAASMLGALGLPELIAPDMEEYERRAVALARDPARLTALRNKLAANKAVAPLFDTARFTRNLEAAYQRMWDSWRKGEKPQAFRA